MSNTKADACPPSQGEGPAVNIRGCTVHEQILTPIYKPTDAHVSYTPTRGVPPSTPIFEFISFTIPLALIFLCFGLLFFFDKDK